MLYRNNHLRISRCRVPALQTMNNTGEHAELLRVKSGVAGPDGVVLVVARPESPASHEVEFWYIPLNQQLPALCQALTMGDMSAEMACSVMRETGLGELANTYAKRFEDKFPNIGGPKPLEHASIEWDLLRQWWFGNKLGNHLEAIQAKTRSRLVRERIEAITSLSRPKIEPFE